MTQKTTLYLPDDVHLRLRQLARQVDRPQAELIREALVQYLADASPRRPASVGVGSDQFQATDTERWLHDEWSRR